MALGYTGKDDYFHVSEACHRLDGKPRDVPETKALKWGMSYCPICVPSDPSDDPDLAGLDP